MTSSPAKASFIICFWFLFTSSS
ncbi:rCG53236 [Rattus norvegicus]|uniref:RCG53236 n=1 Tax=Rattus norvegicus TaxID=10116 RepID=A6JMQ0_RAT|nr:rCG53236 [Rattus norvegicus]